MSDTKQFALPLIAGAQAQKHVVVNEALARLDAVAQMRVQADDLNNPPSTAVDGEAYVVGSAPGGAWAGRAANVAVFANGGWVFLTPRAGWRAWNVAISAEIFFDGVQWIRHARIVAPGGAATLSRVVEIDHVLDAAGMSSIAAAIPANAQVTGVTGRVTDAISGSGVASWSLGVAGAANRYGSGLGLAKNSYVNGPSGPTTYWADTALEITTDAGTFAAGSVRISVHYLELVPPRAV